MAPPFTITTTLAIAILSTALSLYSSGSSLFAVAWSAFSSAYLACFLVSVFLPRRPTPPPVSEAEFASLCPPPDPSADQSALYLDLLKRVLLNIVYHEQSYQVSLTRSKASGRKLPQLVGDPPGRFMLKPRIEGEDISLNTLSMIGLPRLNNVQECVEAVVDEDVPGDLIETGVAKGGATILMRAVLRAKGDEYRRVFCCDTFAEDKPPPKPAVALIFLPIWLIVVTLSYLIPARRFYAKLMKLQHSFPVDMEHTSQDTVDSFLFFVRNGHKFIRPAVPSIGRSLQAVRSHFARLGLLDDRVVFLKGFFSETLPAAPLEQLSLIRLDGDLYASTMDALVHLYPKLSDGGYCIVDDYFSFEECKEAVDEYREREAITAPLIQIDAHSVYWRHEGGKGGGAAQIKSAKSRKAGSKARQARSPAKKR